jgi:hypothetical protein
MGHACTVNNLYSGGDHHEYKKMTQFLLNCKKKSNVYNDYISMISMSMDVADDLGNDGLIPIKVMPDEVVDKRRVSSDKPSDVPEKSGDACRHAGCLKLRVMRDRFVKACKKLNFKF